MKSAQSVEPLFERLWEQYRAQTPQAEQIHERLLGRGERPVNDHVALRTFAGGALGLEMLEARLLSLGFKPQGDYQFPEKKLNARSYLHERGAEVPKIFLSELLVEELSAHAQALLRPLLDALEELNFEALSPEELFSSGRHWPLLSAARYERLARESEYAAWLSVWGLRANHFTISVDQLESFSGLPELLQWLEREGFTLSRAGGLIKGTPEALLEQASTCADLQELRFACGTVRAVPSCFYEFALRHRDAAGRRFEGFVTGNAARIFESTDRRGEPAPSS